MMQNDRRMRKLKTKEVPEAIGILVAVTFKLKKCLQQIPGMTWERDLCPEKSIPRNIKIE